MSGQLPNIQENNQQILNDIQSLQSMEQQLFNSLETNPNLSPSQKQKIVQQMNQISNMRINLYQTLSGINNYYSSALNSSIGTLKEQTVAISIVENELNKSKKRLEILEAEKNNKVRLVEINDYYGEKYAEHATLMKIIIFTLIPIIILAILNSNGILPNTIYYILIAIILFFGLIYFIYRYLSIIFRDNMNYQEYDWDFNLSAAPKGSSSSSDPWATNKSLGTCIGPACCSNGQMWDSNLNQCVGTSTVIVTPSSSATTETFVNNVLTKTSGKYKNDVDLKNPMPNVSDSFINYRAKKY
jgi:hypothetical protein